MSVPVALTIAGSDPSGGAGIQADLKTFSALGVYGTAVLTALTAQSTRGVTGTHAVPPDFVTAQLRTLLDDIRVDAVKIGMLANAGTVHAVAATVRAMPDVPVVLDPVMVATSGDRLLDEDAVTAVRELIPLTSLITPNVPESAVLLQTSPATDVDSLHDQARALLDAGAARVLLKGGHLDDRFEAVDVYADGQGTQVLRAPRVATHNTHGTGCTLSAAIAASKARGTAWSDAVREAKDYLARALAASDELDIGHGAGPVHHFVDQWR